MIDENNLVAKINKLTSLDSSLSQKLKQIKTCLVNLQSIIKENADTMPDDNGKDGLMSTARRQEIYDACMLRVVDLIPTETEEE